MKRHIALAIALLCLTSTAAFSSYCMNKDFTNTGTVPAFDIAILITGNQDITSIFYGFAPGKIGGMTSAGRFSNFSSLFQGGNTLMHWQNLNGTNAPINPNTFVHVGWCTANPNQMVNIFWTDQNGNQLPGSVIQETGAEPNGLQAQWINAFATGTNPAIVSNVRYALPATPFPLAQLNAANTQLAGELQTLGIPTFELAPGASFSAPVPGAAPGQWVVLVYDVNGNGSGAATTDYVQFQF